jgi:predicted TIM-barrel fold metal-dependent hydrolase
MTHKLHEGRDESIVDPELAIVDTHQHLFDRPALKYLMEDYLRDAASGHRVVATVYVETRAFAWSHGPEVLRPLGEVEFANAVGILCATGAYGPTQVCAAIVGYADLREGDAVAGLLDRAMALAPDRFRGVRQPCLEFRDPAAYRYAPNPATPGTLESPGFRQAFRHLGPRGLSFDAAVLHHQLPQIATLADDFPDTTIVLNHLGIAEGIGRDAAGRASAMHEWRTELRELARRPNVMCKIGGLGMPFWGLALEERSEPTTYLDVAAAWEPYVHTGIDCFGVDRCMMSSNYPVDGRSCGFVPLWNALKHLVSGCSRSEKAALFHGTATRVYRIATAVNWIPKPLAACRHSATIGAQVMHGNSFTKHRE